MKLQVLQEDLSKALQDAIRFVSTRSTLPVLGNFLLTAEKAKLKIQSTNLEISLTNSIGANIEVEGKITIQAKIFQEIISSLAKGQITLSLEKEKLIITSDKFSADLETFPANDFPVIPDNINIEKSFSLTSKSISNNLSKVLFSVSSDESRPVLTGILFNFEGEILNLVASDGFRLSRKSINLGKKLSIKDLIIPKNSVLEIIKLSKSEENILIEFKEEDNQLIIKIGETYLTSRLIEGNFPDYKKIIPASSPIKINIDKNELNRGVTLAAVFARNGTSIIRLNISKTTMEISAESGKIGKENSKMDISTDGIAEESSQEVLFNFKYIQDFLTVIGGDNVDMKIIDPVSAVIFIDPKDDEFLHLIMPVRIQN